ncbi:MAG TPA: hypothetical protein VMU93_08590 [Caulobacteraceae bacterium]|nr:hypothetical protein [Caulobacteraceae bacterium]
MKDSNGKTHFGRQTPVDGFAAMGAMGAMVRDANQRGQVILETGLRTWETEAGRYFDEAAAQCRATVEALARCASPSDVLAVEHAWLKARGEAYLDSGLRFAEAFACVAQSLAAKETAASRQAADGERATGA